MPNGLKVTKEDTPAEETVLESRWEHGAKPSGPVDKTRVKIPGPGWRLQRDDRTSTSATNPSMEGRCWLFASSVQVTK